MTIEKLITDYLERKDFVFAGVIEDHIRTINGAKGETTSRILRYMANKGIIERGYENTGHGKPNVKYRINKYGFTRYQKILPKENGLKQATIFA